MQHPLLISYDIKTTGWPPQWRCSTMTFVLCFTPEGWGGTAEWALLARGSRMGGLLVGRVLETTAGLLNPLSAFSNGASVPCPALAIAQKPQGVLSWI